MVAKANTPNIGNPHYETDAEIAGVLRAISIVALRIAKKLERLDGQQTQEAGGEEDVQ
jgi:hypothetical protein